MRTLIVSFWIFIALEIVVLIAFPEKLPLAIEDALADLPEIEYTPFVISCLVISFISAVLCLVASIGLYLNKTWAPISGLIGTILGISVYFIFPVSAYGPISETLGMIGYTLWGSILGLSFSKDYAASTQMERR